MSMSTKEKATYVKNFAAVVMGPFVLYAVALGDNLEIRVILFFSWLIAFFSALWKHREIMNDTASEQTLAFYDNYQIPKLFQGIPLHKFWTGEKNV